MGTGVLVSRRDRLAAGHRLLTNCSYAYRIGYLTCELIRRRRLSSDWNGIKHRHGSSKEKIGRAIGTAGGAKPLYDQVQRVAGREIAVIRLRSIKC